MYSSGYSQVSKYSPQAQKKMQYRSSGKSCGYYMRIVFFFSSLIQSLIIVSLVLFLIYGKKQDSASTSRIQDLEESFSRLSIENVALRHQRKNLTTLLNSTLTEKARNDWDLAKLRYFTNISAILIQDMDKRLKQCTAELIFCKSLTRPPGQCPQLQPGVCNCGLLAEELKTRLDLVESNFTQTTREMRMEMDQIARERDNLNLEVIRLRRDRATHQRTVEHYKDKCKEDFAQSLSGVTNVTKAFLEKVESLFPAHIAFQLTCPKQREHLEQIRTNCTSLSRDVEDKFQRYLNSVGEQVSGIQSENSRLKAENWRLSEDYRWCSQNRTGLIQQHRQNLTKIQQKHDEDKEKLLLDKIRLNGEIEVLGNNVKYKSKEAEHLAQKLKELNLTCMSKTGLGGFPGVPQTGQTGWGSSSASSSSSVLDQLGRTGSGLSFGSSGSTFSKPLSTGTGSSSSSILSSGSSSSIGSGYNRQGSTGTGSSSSSILSSGSSSSIGSGYNRQGSTGTGSSSSSILSSGSSSSIGSGYNRQGSTGTGSSSTSILSGGSGSSTGSGYNRQGSTGTGSSSTSILSGGSGSSTGLGYNKPGSTGGVASSYGSTGSNPSLSSSGTGSNKPALSGRGSSTVGSSSGLSGLIPNFSLSGTGSNKPTSSVKSSPGLGSSSGSTGSTSKTGSGLSWFGLGTNSGQSKTGGGTGKVPSSGNSLGGTGSSIGAGRTSGLGVSVAQHLQDLQRLINPAGPEEKQDLARILG
ncbi:plasmalemma vesicle associated protein a [Chaetodon trifascialis]|uniref:plasmalemma vesicle associated protein a n=1 Tax=Chaetodon trifascialis TaxID=109706 RepID=UPI003993DEBE